MAPASTEGLSPAAQAQFKVLQQGFVAGLAARWLEVETAATPQALQFALHRLCGSAGSFGFTGLSQSARVAEALALTDSDDRLAQALGLLREQIELAQSAQRAGDAPVHP